MAPQGRKRRKGKGRRGRDAPASPPPPADAAAGADRTDLYVALGIGLFAFALYAVSLGNLYSIDDNLVIYGNEFVEQGFAGIDELLVTPFTYGISEVNDNGYRPLPMITFAVEVGLFGEQAFVAQHLHHVLIYVVTAILLYTLLARLLRRRGRAIAIAACLIWVAHPVHTEVVANLKSRDEMLGFLFGLVLTLLLLVRHLDTGRRRYWALAAGTFFLGLVSKESVVTYVAAIPLCLWTFSELRLRQIGRLMLPLLGVVGLYLGIRYAVLSRFPTEEYDLLQNPLFGANSWDIRHATAIKVLLHYLRLSVFPHPLVWDYSYNQIPLVDFRDPWVLLSLALHAGLLAVAVARVRRRCIWAFGILSYLVTLSIASNLFIITPSLLGERFLYTPTLSVSIMAALALAWLVGSRRQPFDAALGFRLALALGVVLLPAGIKTVTRARQWKDSLTISLVDIETSPNSIRTTSTLAAVYLALAKKPENRHLLKKLHRQVIPLCKRILSIYPDHQEASYNLGISHYHVGDFNAAEKAFLEHLERHPDDVKTYNNLAGLYYFRKDYQTALKFFHKFVEANPDDARAVNNLGVIRLDNLRRPREAISFFERAIKLDPEFAEPHMKKGNALLMLGEPRLAVAAYRRAIELAPDKMGHLRRRVAMITARLEGRAPLLPPGVTLPPGITLRPRRGLKLPPNIKLPPGALPAPRTPPPPTEEEQ